MYSKKDLAMTASEISAFYLQTEFCREICTVLDSAIQMSA